MDQKTEIGELIVEVEQTLAVFQAGLREAMATLRSEPLEVVMEVFHANRSLMVRKPNPALRRVREIHASMRALELRLKKLRVEEQALAKAQNLAAEDNPWKEFIPKERKSENPE
jgi:allophanate hydrolase subunit 1